jgi:hypothetical protein
MPVKILPASEKEINEFLVTPSIKISTKHVIPSISGNPHMAFFYETAQEDQAAKDRALIEQNDQMDKLIEIAREVAKDKNYNILKNIAQREIYLFTQYNLSKADATTVQTLLTSEMRPVLMGA